MAQSPHPKRILAIGTLWTVIGLMGWLLFFQAALIVFATRGEWQAPDVYEVQVVEVQKDSQNAFTRDVDVTIDGELDTITLPKSEAVPLHRGDSFWVLDNFYATPIRPAQFKLTPWRVLAEYPEILLLAAVLLLLRIRRSKWGLPKEPPPGEAPPRTVYRDTFHVRAQRHAAPPEREMDNPDTPV
jgi:hypothetical protein